jgi:hypothetical protein
MGCLGFAAVTVLAVLQILLQPSPEALQTSKVNALKIIICTQSQIKGRTAPEAAKALPPPPPPLRNEELFLG